MAAAGVCLTACNESTPSAVEQSGPVLTWSVLNQNTRESQTFPAQGHIKAGREDHFFIVFKANDAGGIKSMKLGGGADWTCESGQIGQNSVADFASQTRSFHPNSKGQVEDYEFMVQNLDVSGWTCQSGFSFVSGGATLDGSATNYSNKVSTAALTIERVG